MKNLNSGHEYSPDAALFYERLPRYVKEPLTANSLELPAVKRVVELSGRTFVLTITPACSINHLPHGLEFGRRRLFPGAEEELVEKALRRLCVATNTNFDARRSVLCFAYGEFRKVYETLTHDPELTDGKLEKSLFVLLDSNYVLKLGSKEYYFRAIDRISSVEEEGEKYYRVDFSPLFFDRGELFNRIFGILGNH